MGNIFFVFFYKTRHMLLSDSAHCTVLCAVVLTQYRRVTDRLTDGQTDGIAIASTALAMRALRRAVKTCRSGLVRDFAECWPIFKILSSGGQAVNLKWCHHQWPLAVAWTCYYLLQYTVEYLAPFDAQRLMAGFLRHPIDCTWKAIRQRWNKYETWK